MSLTNRLLRYSKKCLSEKLDPDFADAVFEAEKEIKELITDRDSLDDQVNALYGALPRWIPVTERLPDFEGCLLCMVEDGTYAGIRYQTILYFDERGFTDGFGTSEDLIVTHWMPLPEPPKEL